MRYFNLLLFVLFISLIPVFAQIPQPTSSGISDYWIGLFNSKENAEEFFLSFQKAVEADDKTVLTSIINFPVLTTLHNGKMIKISEKSFLTKYNHIFHKKFKKKILNAKVSDLWGFPQKMTFGSGSVWIVCSDNAEKKEPCNPKIITLNNQER